MTNSAIVEVLPPEPSSYRESDGRFKQGAPGGPGRSAGTGIGFTQMMRREISAAFEEVGGRDYLIMLAYWKPELFVTLMGRTLPIKVVGDDDASIEVVRRVERVVLPRKP